MRRLSIRTRTAISFAVLFVVLAAGVLAFVAGMTQRALSDSIADAGVSIATNAPPPDGVTGPRRGDAGPAIAVVRTASEQQWLWAGVGVVVAGLVAGVAGWLVSRRMLRPLDAITRTAARISASTLDERIALDGPDDELRRLARTIDDLLGRLEASFASQRRFVAQASHELRTPLAVQRTAIQVGLDDAATPATITRTRADLLAANRRTEMLVDGLLALAEAERGLDGRTEPCALDALVAEALREHAGAAQAAGVELRGGAVPGLPSVPGDPVLLRQLLRNLVENAIEYNRPGGFVAVHATAAGVRVENTGPGVPAELLRSIREPFVRGDRYRSSESGRRHNGVGLSIVDAVARAHGWGLTIRPRPGGGLVVDIATDRVSPISPTAERP